MLKEAEAVAIFHVTTRSISRSSGTSAVAVAAQRTACRLVDERTGQVRDHAHKVGVVSAEILLPDGGTTGRQELWNAAEAAERRKDGRTARESTTPPNSVNWMELAKAGSPVDQAQ